MKELREDRRPPVRFAQGDLPDVLHGGFLARIKASPMPDRAAPRGAERQGMSPRQV
jgi:hypothetical protein